MASDLPEMHRSPEAMARCLATYIADPERVRLEVNVAFGSAPCAYTIKEMRRRHLERLEREPEPIRPDEGYWPQSVADEAAQTSRVFLARLRRAHPQRFEA